MLDDILHNKHIPVIVQGATGRAARQHLILMRRYGTEVCAGVSPDSKTPYVDDVPIFASCREAVAATGACTSVIMVPSLSVVDAIDEALDAGIRFLVTVTEGVPVHDVLKAYWKVRAADALWIGPSTPGIAIPGKLKLGFIPNRSLSPGVLGVMSKSGTLSYEICARLSRSGVGQSAWIGVGGDAVKGTRFPDLVSTFLKHDSTQALLVIGEIGGTEEEELAEKLDEVGFSKPVFVILTGANALEGVTMGHAGALLYGSKGTLRSKIHALRAVGAEVFVHMNELVACVVDTLTTKSN